MQNLKYCLVFQEQAGLQITVFLIASHQIPILLLLNISIKQVHNIKILIELHSSFQLILHTFLIMLRSLWAQKCVSDQQL